MPASTGSSHSDLHHAPEAALSLALLQLRQAGERLTAPRHSVLGVLAHHHDSLTADAVAEILASEGIHRATVYRTFEVLTRSGIVAQQLRPGGAVAYHLVTSPAGHEHLHGICRSCGLVSVLPADALDDITRMLQTSTGFSLEPEQSTLVGRCRSCTPP